MRRKYENAFKAIGYQRLSHCIGDDWQEVWTDFQWQTGRMTARRTRFLWRQILRCAPELETTFQPKFYPNRKYRLVINEDDSGRRTLMVRRER